jgi:hypothetical protein
MTATTFATGLAKIGVSVPAHLVADAEVPVLTEPQPQGDLMIIPITSTRATLQALPQAGHQVVVGEQTGNTHWLHRGFDSPDVQFARVEGTPHADSPLALVVVSVPEGQTAELIHTDEHGVNAMGPGLYVIHGKREQADEIRRVVD